MATNSYNNAVRITKMAMDCLENNLTLTKFVNREYKSEFADTGAKMGDTINVRIPGFYGVRQGSTAQPQGYNDTYIPVTLNQFGADLEFTTKDLRLAIEDGEAFQQNVLNPLIAPVANYADSLIAGLYTSVTNSTGTPGTKPTDLTYYLNAGALLDDNAAPRDGQRSAVISPWSQASMVQGLKGLFHSADQIQRQYEEGTMGLAAGLKFSMDQNIKTHTTGTFGTSTPLMNGSTLDGATQIVTNGWASNASALKKGDQISIGGVYAVNPVSKASTGELKLFTVTADCDDTTGDMTIKISPAITVSGPNQNVDAVPLNDAAIYVWGKNDNTYSAKVSATSLLLHKDALALATVDLPLPMGGVVFAKRIRTRQLGIPIRLIQWYNGNSDQTLFRLDILAGAALKRENFAARIVG